MPRFAAFLLLAVLAVAGGAAGAGAAADHGRPTVLASDGYGWGAAPQTP
ncbi:hypothetical protein ACFW1A_17375 [Kitasatospora sp. NPDC058965]